MITSLKSWQLRKAISNHPNHKKRINTAIANSGSDILILAEIASQDSVKRFIDTLKKNGKKAKVIYYASNEVESTLGNIITPKQTTWYGVPQNEYIDKILAKDFDMLICLKYDMQAWDLYCLELAKSRFNIGPNINSMIKYFDLIIDQNSTDVDNLINVILAQLKILSKN